MRLLGRKMPGNFFRVTYEFSGATTLWEGRFWSCLIGEEDYFLGCQRYIELNPVWAEMVKRPGEYPWSSYGYNAQGFTNSLIRPHALYKRLGRSIQKRQEVYRELFRYELDPGLVDEIRSATNGGFVLGTERFQKEIFAMLGRRTWRGSPGRPIKPENDEDQQELEL
jgi:putative transposase